MDRMELLGVPPECPAHDTLVLVFVILNIEIIICLRARILDHPDILEILA